MPLMGAVSCIAAPSLLSWALALAITSAATLTPPTAALPASAALLPTLPNLVWKLPLSTAYCSALVKISLICCGVNSASNI